MGDNRKVEVVGDTICRRYYILYPTGRDPNFLNTIYCVPLAFANGTTVEIVI